jgi:spermidine synthase
VADGAQFIQDTPHIYDLIFIDAYSGEGIPEALFGPEFFDALKARLSIDGVVILNLHKQKGKENSFIKALQPRLPLIACVRSSDDLNLVLFCKRSSMPTHANLIGVAKTFTADSNPSFDLGKIAKKVRITCLIGD